MLLSRFWYLFLAIVVGLAGAAAMLAMGTFNRQYDSDVNDALRRDRFEVELILKMDARSRIDAIGPIAAQSDVRTALRQASGRRDPNVIDTGLRTGLDAKLVDLNGQLEEMRADLLFAVDDAGYIIGSVGVSNPPAGAGLGRVPLVRRALEGYLRDDVWMWNGQVYRMAARPVIDGGQYVGAIVHGKRLDEDLAEKLSERIGEATVVFFSGNQVIAGHMPTIEGAARREDIEAKLAAVLTSDRLRQGQSTDPVDVGGSARAVYSLVAGSASHAMVGYAISRPRESLSSPIEIFQRATSADVDAVFVQLVAISGGAFVLFLLAMAWVWLERDRPVGKMKRATAALAKREVDRLTITDFGGPYRKVAENVNEALDKAVEKAATSAPKRKAADLDQILGPTPGQQPASFFGFANEEGSGPAEIPSVPPAPGPAPAAPPRPAAAAAPPVPAKPAAGPPAPTGAFGGPKPGAPPPPAPPGRPPAPPPPARGAPPAPPPRAPMAPAAAAPAPAPVAAPAAVAAAAPAPAAAAKPAWAKGTLVGMNDPNARPAAQAPGEFGEEEDEAATTIAQVPDELLKSASEGDLEQRHFREVFDQFLATKRQCGEPTAGLTFDKFVQTLRKNKEQIVSRHGAKNVRFTVYVKDGKAALKATPVRD